MILEVLAAFVDWIVRSCRGGLLGGMALLAGVGFVAAADDLGRVVGAALAGNLLRFTVGSYFFSSLTASFSGSYLPERADFTTKSLLRDFMSFSLRFASLALVSPFLDSVLPLSDFFSSLIMLFSASNGLVTSFVD